MGLNLSALDKLKQGTNSEPTKQSEQRIELPKQEASATSIVHAAASKPNQVITSLAALESLANSKPATQVNVDQSGGVSTTGKTIKYQEISDSIEELRTAIHGAHPRMPGLLQEIWKTLQSYPEQVSLLEEDQARIIVNGLEKVVDTDLANLTIKSAIKGGKAGKAAITTDSLGF